jgi:cytohesin
MRLTHLALATALSLTFGTHTHAQTTCGEICTYDFWEAATPPEISGAIATVGVKGRNEFGSTPLHYAVLQGTLKNFLILLEAGADVNARTEDGLTPLHGAAAHGTPEGIQILLEAGADVNARDEDGGTPLHTAITIGIQENILALLVSVVI